MLPRLFINHFHPASCPSRLNITSRSFRPFQIPSTRLQSTATHVIDGVKNQETTVKPMWRRWRKRERTRRPFRGTMQVLGAFGLMSIPVLLWFQFDPRSHYVIAALTRSLRAANTVLRIAFDYKWTLRNGPEKIGQQAYEEKKHQVHERSAQRLYDMARLNGGVFIKLGQHISAMAYILPQEYVQAMKPLLDQCPRSSIADLNTMFVTDTGKSIDEWFVDFDPEPLGVASLAQVHRARLQNGREVAVKCQHPTLELYAQIDMDTVTSLVKWIKRIFPQFEFTWLADEMHENLPKELDFRVEASNCRKLGELFKDDPVLKVPEIYEARERIMVMEFVSGSRIDDLTYMYRHNIDPRKVSAEMTDIFSRMIYEYGFIHADPHPANVKVRAKPNGRPYNFDIILLDHGLYRSLSDKFRFDYALLWSALIQGDEARIEKQCNKLFEEARKDEWKRRVARGDELSWEDFVKEQERGVGTGPPSYKLFASILTGRSWNALVDDEKRFSDDDELTQHFGVDGQEVQKVKKRGGLAAPRTSQEMDLIANVAGSSEFLIDLAAVLAKVPRELLLLLKTNDLLRALDEDLVVGGIVKSPKMEADPAGSMDVSEHMMKTVARMGWHVARAVKEGRMQALDDRLQEKGILVNNLWSRFRYHVLSWKAIQIKWEFMKVTARLIALDVWLGFRHLVDRLVGFARL